METFDADWLALREPADRRSRDPRLPERLREAWRRRGWARVVDLGAGAGANLRYLAPRLPAGQRWTLVDHDPRHVDRLRSLAAPPGVETLTAVSADLAGVSSSTSSQTKVGTLTALSRDGPGVVDLRGARASAADANRDLAADGLGLPPGEHPRRGEGDAHRDFAADGLGVVDGADLVTASALLDLVSEPWLAGLVRRCAAAAAGAYFALTYDGAVRWTVESAGRWRVDRDPDDDLVRSAVNRHQRGDKGFGPALGPAAASVAARLFRAAGYRTWLVASDWRLEAADGRLAARLVEGWAEAAAELRPETAERVGAWAARRRAAVSRGSFRVTVGHRDLLALPGGSA